MAKPDIGHRQSGRGGGGGGVYIWLGSVIPSCHSFIHLHASVAFCAADVVSLLPRSHNASVLVLHHRQSSISSILSSVFTTKI